MKRRRIEYDGDTLDKLSRLWGRFLYHFAGAGGGFVLGGIGFGIGMEFCPYGYILPVLLALIGAPIGYHLFKGAPIRGGRPF